MFSVYEKTLCLRKSGALSLDEGSALSTGILFEKKLQSLFTVWFFINIFSAEEKIDQLYVGHFHIMSSGVLPAPNTHKNPSNFPTLVRLAIKSKNLKNKSDFQDLLVWCFQDFLCVRMKGTTLEGARDTVAPFLVARSWWKPGRVS